MSFTIMYNYGTVFDMLQSRFFHYIILQVLIWKWHFDTGRTLPLVRHLVCFHSWFVIFILYFILHIRYILIYIRMYFNFKYTSDLIV